MNVSRENAKQLMGDFSQSTRVTNSNTAFTFLRVDSRYTAMVLSLQAITTFRPTYACFFLLDDPARALASCSRMYLHIP